jgi:hypothetical protein
MFSRTLIACLLAAVLSGCSAGASFFGPSTGTVTGHVQLRVCGGAYRPDQTGCSLRPMGDATLTFALAGTSSSSTVTTDSAGAYRIDLKPGTYTVKVTEMGSAKQPKPGAFADNPATVHESPGANTVTAVAGQTVTRDFTYTIQMM